MTMGDPDDPWARAPRIIPVIGGPADGSLMRRPSTDRIVFPGVGPGGRTTVTYTVRKFLRAGAIVEVLVHGDELNDAVFIQKHGLTPIQ